MNSTKSFAALALPLRKLIWSCHQSRDDLQGLSWGWGYWSPRLSLPMIITNQEFQEQLGWAPVYQWNSLWKVLGTFPCRVETSMQVFSIIVIIKGDREGVAGLQSHPHATAAHSPPCLDLSPCLLISELHGTWFNQWKTVGQALC